MMKEQEYRNTLTITPSGLVPLMKPILLERPGNKPFFVHIAGASGAGKTTCSQLLTEGLPFVSFKLFPMDTYMFGSDYVEKFVQEDPSSFGWDDLKNFDLPSISSDIQLLKTGSVIHMPLFDRNTKNRQPERIEMEATNSDVVIIEGIHGLSEQFPRADFSIYVKADLHNRLWRRVLRALDRGSSNLNTTVTNYLQKVEPSFAPYARSFESKADVVVYNPFDARHLVRSVSADETSSDDSILECEQLIPKSIYGKKSDEELLLIKTRCQQCTLQYAVLGELLVSKPITKNTYTLLKQYYDFFTV